MSVATDTKKGASVKRMNIIDAVQDALFVAMESDPDVLVFGEDVGGFGGVFRATVGLQEKFGEERCFDTPLSEAGIIAAAIGMAGRGLRPVPEIQFSDFIFPAFDHIVNELAKYRYRSGGQFACPVTIRTPYGGGIKGGHYHSQSPEALFLHTPGLKIVTPSNPYDAKGLLLASIRCNDPVMFFEPKRIYRASKGEVPQGEDYEVELGKANVVREGDAVTVISYGAMVHVAMDAAKQAAEYGIECEVIDLRTLNPLDTETIVNSVRRTGKVIVVNEAPQTCGFAGELIAIINEKAFLYLEAPPRRLTGLDTPFPYTLEHEYLPDAERIRQAIVETVNY